MNIQAFINIILGLTLWLGVAHTKEVSANQPTAVQMVSPLAFLLFPEPPVIREAPAEKDNDFIYLVKKGTHRHGAVHGKSKHHHHHYHGTHNKRKHHHHHYRGTHNKSKHHYHPRHHHKKHR